MPTIGIVMCSFPEPEYSPDLERIRHVGRSVVGPRRKIGRLLPSGAELRPRLCTAGMSEIEHLFEATEEMQVAHYGLM